MDAPTQPTPDPVTPVTQPEAAAPAQAPATPPLSTTYKRLAKPALWLLLAIACVTLVLWARSFGTRVVQSRPVNARIEILNPPAWLDRRIVQSLLDEAYQFAGRDTDTYNRTRDILDSAILKEFANLYTGTGPDGKPRQAVGFNAWISKVVQVRRNVAQDNGMQAIQITAQWRQPAAWIRVGANDAATCYLIDPAGTRLPGEYHLADIRGSRLMTLAGIDLPSTGVPAPGAAWHTKADTLGDDLSAGLKLIDLLDAQKFTAQIAAINLENYGGRRDPLASWINLETIWPAGGDVPRVIAWGRPIGEEKYYEVQANAKVRTLKDIYAKFGRIDANRLALDIRTDFVRTPKFASQQDAPAQAGL